MSIPHNCEDCKLTKSRQRVVRPSGNPNSPMYMIVGVAPARQDEDEGEAFRSGEARVMKALLHEAGVPASECYFTYLSKCRPPNNRPLDPDEIFACAPKLFKEIDFISPRYIIALGGQVAGVLTGKDDIQDWRGMILPTIGRKHIPCLITLESGFVMKMRTMFPVVVWDLQKLLNFEKLPEVEVSYSYHPSREEIIATFDLIKENNYATAVDIETAGDKEDGELTADALNPWKGEIIGIAFAWKPGHAIQLDTATMLRNWDLVADLLATHTRQIYANNIFDRLFIWVAKGVKPHLEWDVQSAMHMIYPELPKKLDFLRSLYTNIPPYKSIYKKKAGGKYRPERLTADDLAHLNCLDVDVTLRVFEAQRKHIRQDHMDSMLQEEQIALEMKHRGAYIDQDQLALHYMRILPEIEKIRDIFETQHHVSVSSPKQLKEFLYVKLALPPYDDKGKSTTAKLASTNEKAIQALGNALGLIYLNDDDGERFEGTHPQAEVFSTLLRFRGLQKIASTYCEGFYKSIQSDLCVHPGWKPTGTATGRWSCVTVPLQGVPKDMRNIVRARPGKIFVGADYKGMQIVGAGILAEDWELVENMLKPEYSIHEEVLQAIKPHYPSIKKIQAKTVVFGTFFGRSARDIAQQFHVPTKTAELWQAIFYSTRPKLKVLFEEKHVKQFEAQGYVLGVDGHKLYCAKATEAKNYPVQHFETRVVKAAAWKLREAGFDLVLNGHDQLVAEIDDDENRDARFEEFCTIMSKARPDLYHTFPIDGGMGYYWSEV